MNIKIRVTYRLMKIKGDNVLVINTKYDTWAHRKYSKLVKKKRITVIIMLPICTKCF